MYLELDAVIHNDITLLMRDKNSHKIVGEIEILDLPDGYTISCKANSYYKQLINKDVNERLEALFADLKYQIEMGYFNTIDLTNKSVYLLADDYIGSRYGIVNELQRIPRSSAFYFIRKEN